MSPFSFCGPATRRLVRRSLVVSSTVHRRWARVHDVRCLVTHGAQERVMAKYKDKLDRKAKETGLRDVDELKAVYQDKIQTVRREAATAPSTEALLQRAERHFPPSPPRPPRAGQVAPLRAGVRRLDSFIDMAKTRQLPKREIEAIWRLRHARNPQSLSAVVSSSAWDTMRRNARAHPQFVLPLPRQAAAAEMHFMQWAFPAEHCTAVLFTHLAEYQARGEFAMPHTTVSFYTEMAASNALVLAQGTVAEKRGVSVDEGRWLLMCLQKFYGPQADSPDRKRKSLLEMFSRGDGGFSVEELLEEAEKI